LNLISKTPGAGVSRRMVSKLMAGPPMIAVVLSTPKPVA
jgi:hypothetical protein